MRVIAGAFALAVVLLVENSAVWRSTSGVFDEPFFLRRAGEAIHDRRFDAFVHGWTAPLPVFAAYTLPAIVSGPGHVDVERFASLITLARVEHALTIGVPLILVVYVWLARRRGILVALVGGGLLVLSPLIVAHTSVATTDASLALTSLLALAALASYQARPSPSRWLLVGVALGCALSAKYSAAFLVPVAAAALLSALYPARSLVVATRLIGTLVGWLLVALLIAWAFHLFQVAPLLSPTAVPRDYQRLFGSGRLATMGLDVGRHVLVPLPLKAMQRLWEHGRTGHPAFLNGETSTHGWWRYFPLAFAMKSTPAELVMLLVVAFAMLWARRPRDPSAMLWRWSMAIYATFAVTSPIDVGVRHLLVLYPLLVLSAVDTIAAWAASRRRFAFVALPLVAAQALSAVTIAPHDLSYFNAFFGGPAEGYRHLVDSNLDWGQDLPALKEAMARRGIRRLRVAYFGSAPLEAYGVAGVPWDTPADPDPAGDGWLAISATYLQGVYCVGDPFAGFRALEPDARVAFSMFLYDLGRADARDAFARATASAAYLRGCGSSDPPSSGP